MIRFTADTNVYISALNFHGIPEQILDFAQEGKINLAISNAIPDELSRTLRNKFRWSESDIHNSQANILSYTELITHTEHIEAVKDDPTDNRILECAVAGSSNYIVTGDKHLLRLGLFGKTQIVTPAEFLAIMTPAT